MNKLIKEEINKLVSQRKGNSTWLEIQYQSYGLIEISKYKTSLPFIDDDFWSRIPLE